MIRCDDITIASRLCQRAGPQTHLDIRVGFIDHYGIGVLFADIAQQSQIRTNITRSQAN